MKLSQPKIKIRLTFTYLYLGLPFSGQLWLFFCSAYGLNGYGPDAQGQKR
jgi:hypothetical protein